MHRMQDQRWVHLGADAEHWQAGTLQKFEKLSSTSG